jgi:hypothetical protein
LEGLAVDRISLDQTTTMIVAAFRTASPQIG